tara:strand:+ start:1546 stop:2109 length:564 start_codon:yes stop_codon:yes gene_type:complete
MDNTLYSLKIIYKDCKRYLYLSKKDSKKNKSFLRLFALLFSIRMAPVLLYRFGSITSNFKIYPLGSLFSLLNRLLFGIEISRFCKIGPGLCIPHPMGVIIGANSIGSNCIIFQGVTIGSKEIDFPVIRKLRPTIGNNVVIGAGAKILGGIYIADDTTIGANAVVTRDILEGGFTYVGIPATRLENND